MINENVKEHFSDEVTYSAMNNAVFVPMNSPFPEALYDALAENACFTVSLRSTMNTIAFLFYNDGPYKLGGCPHDKSYPSGAFLDQPLFYQTLRSLRLGQDQMLRDYLDNRVEEYKRERESAAGIMVQLIRLVRGELDANEINAFYAKHRDDLTFTPVFNEILKKPLDVKKVK